MSPSRSERIRSTLQAVFSPVDLLVKDQSHLHAGHAGASDGKGHFEVLIVAEAFGGKSRIQRHRMIYEALRDVMAQDVHALKIRAYSPSERSSGAN